MAYRTAIELQPNYGETHHHRALALSKLGRAQDAEREFEEARRLGYAPR